jgi:hypothetical protein
VECTGNLHYEIVILLFRIAKKVFDNSTAFDPSNDRLNDNPDTGDEMVLLFLCLGKVFPFGLLARMKRLHPLWFISLQASIFLHTEVLGICGVFFIRNPCIMAFACIGLAQIIALACMDATNNEMLDRVRFFFNNPLKG